MKRGLYRKTNGGLCHWCEFPMMYSGKKLNPKRMCKKCQKEATKNKKKNLINDID